jgi:hypothetical protein
MIILRKRLRDNYQNYMQAYGKYNHKIEDIMKFMRSKIGGFEDLMKPTNESVDFKLEDFEIDFTEFTNEISEITRKNVKSLVYDTQFCKIINDLKILHNNMLAAHINIKRTRSVVSYLKTRRDNEVRMVVRPDENVIRQIIKESTSEIDLSDLNI